MQTCGMTVDCDHVSGGEICQRWGEQKIEK